MSELISRLKEIIEKYNAGCYNETCNPFESCTDCVLKQIREVIESQPPADQWIPCSERLPKESNEYEVTVAYDGLVFTSYSYYSMKESRWCTYPNHITAWRERLSEPYKGE